MYWGVIFVILLCKYPLFDAMLTSVSPRSGSIAGKTRLTVMGTGFSTDQYRGGNVVILKNDLHEVECEVEILHTSSRMITCVTNESPDPSIDISLELVVYSSSGGDFQRIEPCDSCTVTFTYNRRSSPFLRRLDPLTLLCGEALTLTGDLYAIGFGDPDDDLEEPTRDDDAPNDFFTRILVGGRDCSHVKEDGTTYEATIDERGITGSITCLPKRCRIGSMNVTAILARRGASFVNTQDYLYALDNNFNPYHIQTHADIVKVTPNGGSANGGTRITITVRGSLGDYNEEDIEVFVGGVPCFDVTRHSDSGGLYIVECTTRRPPKTSHYPGHRGVLQELFANITDLSELMNSNHSTLNLRQRTIHERLYLENRVSDSQKISGFFVPPLTSLYTFEILSNDKSELYLNLNASEDNLTLVAQSRSKLSSPVLLHAKQPYHFALLGTQQYTNAQFLGLGAKIHNASFNTYPYVGDNEKQMIAISSKVIKEKQKVTTEYLPQVQKLSFFIEDDGPEYASLYSDTLICNSFDVRIIFQHNGEMRIHTFPLSLYANLDEIEETINDIEAVQRFGRIAVFQYDKGQDLEIVFLFVTDHILARSSNIPIFELESEYIPITCHDSAEDSDILVVASLFTTQDAVYPTSFTVGFGNTASPRFTPHLPTNVSGHQFQVELRNLLSQECTYDPLLSNIRILFHDSYEDQLYSPESSTGYCGRFSKQNPRIVWENPKGLQNHPHVCFTFRGEFPGLRVSFSYTPLANRGSFVEVLPEKRAQDTLYVSFDRNTMEVRVSNVISDQASDGSNEWSKFFCMNVEESVVPFLERLLRHVPGCQGACKYRLRVDKLQFRYKEDFWVDDFFITNREFAVTRTSSPPRPNGIDITDIAVEEKQDLEPRIVKRGWPGSDPEYLSGSGSGYWSGSGSGYYSGSGSGFESGGWSGLNPEYAIVISEYEVTYSTQDCGFGIGLIQGSYRVDAVLPQEMLRIYVEQIEEASKPVGGSFDIFLGKDTVYSVPANISAQYLEYLLEETFPHEGGFTVARFGTCAGYSWEVEWETRGGDQAGLSVNGEKLWGKEVELSLDTLVDGGTWLRPLRGDMLRTPGSIPQVDVVISGTPSSCQGEHCSFQFKEELTPVVESVSPIQGQGGIMITIQGRGFGSDKTRVSVVIGRGPCDVVTIRSSSITCMASRHPAGSYKVIVTVDGVGRALNREDTCFTYLLTLDSVSPSSGGIIGGQVITLRGEGFIDIKNSSGSDLDEIYLPWFRHGVGLPNIENLVDLVFSLCHDNYSEQITEKYTKKSIMDYVGKKDFSDSPHFKGPNFTHCSSDTDSQTAPNDNLIPHFAFGLFLDVLLDLLPSHVRIGESFCIILDGGIDYICCVPIPNLPSLANVSVIVFEESATLENAFDIISDTTSVIELVQPEFGLVTGGTILSISGTFLNVSSASDISVTIGASKCDVQSANSTHISCVTGPHSSGSYFVIVSTPSGIAVSKLGLDHIISDGDETMVYLFPSYEYRLFVEVDRFLLEGSLVGEREVLISGGIFIEGETSVFVGGVPAKILSVRSDELIFLTPSPRHPNTKYIHLEKEIIALDCGCIRNQDQIGIEMGDRVKWDWNLNSKTPMLFELSVINRSHHRVAFFSNYDSPQTNHFTFSFNKVGIYYYNITTSDSRSIHNVIMVSEISPILKQIEVSVGGYWAKYKLPNGTDSQTARTINNSDKTKNCSKLLHNIFDKCFQNEPISGFLYSMCATPEVYSVKPQRGSRLDTLFTIHGSKFGSNPETNIVRFGDHECVVLRSNESVIQCMFNASSTIGSSRRLLPLTMVPLSLSLRVANRGSAYIHNRDATIVTLVPVIHSVLPSSSSTRGGTDIIISGDGFWFDRDQRSDQNDMHLGFPCNITSVTYNEIKCTTLSYGFQKIFEIAIHLNGEPLMAICKTACTFNFSNSHTPQVFSVSLSIQQDTTLLILKGLGFSDIAEQNIVKVGDYDCDISSANQTTIACTIGPIPTSNYTISLRICNFTTNSSGGGGGGARRYHTCLGNARVTSEFSTIMVEGHLTGVSPSIGSVQGGTEVNISGRVFNEGDSQNLRVLIGSVECTVMSITLTNILCVTSHQVEGSYRIRVARNGIEYRGNVSYEFSINQTPRVDRIFPRTGQSGDVVTITGSQFGLNHSNKSVLVRVGKSACIINQSLSSESALVCSLGPNFAGIYNISVTVRSMGRAQSWNVLFRYELVVHSLSVTSGSFGGGNDVTINGDGFNPEDVVVTMCNRTCDLTILRLTRIVFVAPQMTHSSLIPTMNRSCDVRVRSSGDSVTLIGGYTYVADATPVVHGVNRTRGGSQGGSALLIRGNGFIGTANVSIAGIECVVVRQNATAIECITEPAYQSIQAEVKVYIDGQGSALSDIEFWYVDLWSSNFTWNGGPLPKEGEYVVIRKGQTLILDTETPILSFLLIMGELIFDREAEDHQVGLHSQGVLITSGGRLEVGTEDDPYLPITEIVIYGHVLSTELPIYGAKSIGLRDGSIDMHGRPLNVTWTRLDKTAHAGENMLYLRDWVQWEAGGRVVVATTSSSQRESEDVMIVSVRPGESGSVLHINVPLKYEHISVKQAINGRVIDTAAEVGYLSRNIVVRGNLNHEWVENITSCEEEFRPGQFEIQTCFDGRFGAEEANDQFGFQFFIHADVENGGYVIARFSYIEITHAGQAFRLGRYPIHFHLNGNVSGSYVRGCAVHHTFNRAVTIHGVDYLLVEKNVVFDVLGHAYFLEDGNEQYNIIQDNLGVFVRGSSSLLNVDITPATFWVVNPNNIVRRNAAAGGSHFGFWYRLPKHPTGPSFTPFMCPRKMPVLEFSDNSAHSFGRFGLWVFHFYYPSPSGNCWDNDPAPAYFDRFFAWRNRKGVEFGETGSMQLRDSVVMDNDMAGVEMTELISTWGKENGALIADTLVVGYSDISLNNSCTESGIKTPSSYYLTVSNVTFVNFDREHCYPIQACSFCKSRQGGFETRYEKISYINSGSVITRWQWKHEHIHRDLDGTLTQTNVPKLLIPTNELLDPALCQHHTQSASSIGGTNGSICDGSTKFGRVAIFDPLPQSLQFAPANITNDHGTISLPFVLKRIIGSSGYMAHLQLNDPTGYLLNWSDGEQFVNISYEMLTSGFEVDDYIIVTHNFPQSLDRTSIRGVTGVQNSSMFVDIASASTGDYYLDSDNTTINYLVKGETDSPNNQFTFSTYHCFYVDCIPPPPPTLPPPLPLERPNVTLRWSDASTWPNSRLPRLGERVKINGSIYVLVDIPIPKLSVLEITDGATLELADEMDHRIEADVILLHGGRLVAGYPDLPFIHRVRIILHGSTFSPEFKVDHFSPTVGAKSFGVFGELILTGHTFLKTWTLLSQASLNGSDSITLVDEVDWEVGHKIVITSTSYDGNQSEVFEIVSVSSDQRTLGLNRPLQYTHTVHVDPMGRYAIRAEVGLLTRSIVVENGNPSQSDRESFGCRVLVSTTSQYSGSALLNGVEFKGCGQLGYTERYDPRFALVLMNLNSETVSYIKECSFHDGYNTAIGVFDANDILIDGNVVHGTVGPSMIITGRGHNVTQNLASLSQFIGTYRDRNEPGNSLWTANYELTDTVNLLFAYNRAAGGAKAAFHMHGEDCETDLSVSIIHSNVGHSSLHCVHLGYSDGVYNCARFYKFTLYSCYHYGFFSFSEAGIHIVESTFVNNKAAVYVSVIGPPSLTHKIGNKSVIIEKSTIVSSVVGLPVSQCEKETDKPPIASHPQSHSGIRAQNGGHVGVVIPSFVSGQGHYPLSAWNSISSYPAISGLTIIRDVDFVNFGSYCNGISDAVITVNPRSEDANHPVHIESVSFTSDTGQLMDEDVKVYIPKPFVRSINPSDCVDMDCDGFKHVLLKDVDGSYTGNRSPHTIISRSEIGWDDVNDRRRGIGDFRIPRAMLTYPNGSKIRVDDIYPEKGVIRGRYFGRDEVCSFKSSWNMYLCSELEHLLLVIESLDKDTETRRLSPIGLGGNGFINLINGPMDHGWCGGYTCQERISTFYGLVASGFSYNISFTSTNPQKLAFHLLNSEADQGIVVGITYTSPQRLDVHIDESDEYIVPKNALLVDRNLRYMAPTGQVDEFLPTPSDPHGTNFYDRATKKMYVTIRGRQPCRIITTPIIALSLTISVSENDFFAEENVERNLALLFNIPMSRIRIVNIVRESRRKKRTSGETMDIEFEIADPPSSQAKSDDDEEEESDDSSGDNDDRSYRELEDLVGSITESLQLNADDSLPFTIIRANLKGPIPPPQDSTGGIRASNETGGPQPEDVSPNSTILTYGERTVNLLNTSITPSVSLSFPSYLSIEQIVSFGVVEGLISSAELSPLIVMYDINNQVAHTLGVVVPWILSAIISSGPDGAFLIGSSSNFTDGEANFYDLVFSHPGSYTLAFTIISPVSANFSIMSSQMITVAPRHLELEIMVEPRNGNTTFRLFPYPVVQLVDVTNELSFFLTDDVNWKGSAWLVEARVENQEGIGQLVRMVNGEAIFDNITVPSVGVHRIEFKLYEENDQSMDIFGSVSTISQEFTLVDVVAITRFSFTFLEDFARTIGDDVGAFDREFTRIFSLRYQNAEVINVTSTNGSIIVSVYITAQSLDELIATVDEVLSDETFLFNYNDVILVVSSVEQDPDLLVGDFPSSSLILIKALVSFFTLLLFLAAVVVTFSVIVYLLYKKSSYRKVSMIMVRPRDMTLPLSQLQYSDYCAEIDCRTPSPLSVSKISDFTFANPQFSGEEDLFEKESVNKEKKPF